MLQGETENLAIQQVQIFTIWLPCLFAQRLPYPFTIFLDGYPLLAGLF